MGFIGYFVKLIHIPMYVSFVMDDVLRFDLRPLRNNILVYVFFFIVGESLLITTVEAHNHISSNHST